MVTRIGPKSGADPAADGGGAFKWSQAIDDSTSSNSFTALGTEFMRWEGSDLLGTPTLMTIMASFGGGIGETFDVRVFDESNGQVIAFSNGLEQGATNRELSTPANVTTDGANWSVQALVSAAAPAVSVGSLHVVHGS